MFCIAGQAVDGGAEPTRLHSDSPMTPANAVVDSGVPDSAEYVVDPKQRADDNLHAGLISKFPGGRREMMPALPTAGEPPCFLLLSLFVARSYVQVL